MRFVLSNLARRKEKALKSPSISYFDKFVYCYFEVSGSSFLSAEEISCALEAPLQNVARSLSSLKAAGFINEATSPEAPVFRPYIPVSSSSQVSMTSGLQQSLMSQAQSESKFDRYNSKWTKPLNKKISSVDPSNYDEWDQKNAPTILHKVYRETVMSSFPGSRVTKAVPKTLAMWKNFYSRVDLPMDEACSYVENLLKNWDFIKKKKSFMSLPPVPQVENIVSSTMDEFLNHKWSIEPSGSGSNSDGYSGYEGF